MSTYFNNFPRIQTISNDELRPIIITHRFFPRFKNFFLVDLCYPKYNNWLATTGDPLEKPPMRSTPNVSQSRAPRIS